MSRADILELTVAIVQLQGKGLHRRGPRGRGDMGEGLGGGVTWERA